MLELLNACPDLIIKDTDHSESVCDGYGGVHNLREIGTWQSFH